MDVGELRQWPDAQQKWLGRGSFGEAFRALYCGTPAAVKELLTGKDQMAAVRREAREELKREIGILSALRHPNIVCMIAFDSRYIVMDMYQGNARKLRSLEDVAIVGRDCMRGISYMHLHGKCIVHGDIKPDNILVNYDPNGNISKAALGDVGLARACAKALRDRDFQGTPGYTPAPNPVVHSMHDLYSLAVSLLDAFLGESPGDVHASNEDYNLDDNTSCFLTRVPDPAYRDVISDMLSTYLLEKVSKAEKGELLRDIIFGWDTIANNLHANSGMSSVISSDRSMDALTAMSVINTF
ncbi:unnamed protein product [Ectocarpus sp. 12 AP-2014]